MIETALTVILILSFPFWPWVIIIGTLHARQAVANRKKKAAP